AASPAERARLNYDARSLLTSWGDRKASDAAHLHDYGNKEWAGLMRDYYRLRWQAYFESLDAELRTGRPALPIDWFALAEKWNHGTQHYSPDPQGDPLQVATRVAEALGLPVTR
ncbi:MAG TPA: alpha-N-acetylglucosaminidase C-terminal domain-containing protein, partial [Candidatus Dormibacteraeota bacterium]|nr:alpha-N-acetylglucosaminidase C-terminal domain-containing protein [Candidatus Dormibacteraeota bacterium]